MSVGGIASGVHTPPKWQPLALQPSSDLGDLLDERLTFEARYGLYTDLRELAGGGTITVPPDHPLDESALRSISLLSVVEAEYRATPSFAPALTDTRRGLLERQRPHRGTHTPYEIRLGEGTRDLAVWFDSTLIVVAADRTSAGSP